MIKCLSPVLLFSIALTAQSFQTGPNGVVVSASKIASDIGIEVLKSGGNVVDAAVAVGFALAVVYPSAGNIGGGGFMVLRTPDGEITTIDFREKAPRAASRDMYLDEKGEPIQGLSIRGPLAAGVPGSVAGYAFVHQKYGTRKWKELLAPAVRLATQGFPVTYYVHQGISSKRELFTQYSASLQMFCPEGEVPPIGSTLQFPDLGATLDRIARFGPREFYEGETAKLLAESVRREGGIISEWDLKHYQAVERPPVHFRYRGYDIYSMPPPSSGGVCLGQILKIIAHFPIADYGFHSSKMIQVMVEAERRAYANRAHYLGDPDFVEIPVDYLLSDNLLDSLAAAIDLRQAMPSQKVRHSPPPESEETTHFSIADRAGWAVAVTTTLNSGFGSGFVAAETGILLNNEMDDFSIKPGVPNMYGLLGAEANAIQSRKRMLSSMTPTIVTRDDRLQWVLGTPGGATIITSVAQVLVNLIDYHMPLSGAVNVPRFHHQWWPDKIYVERFAFPRDVIDILNEKNYVIEERGAIGDVNAIAAQQATGYFIGVPDRRRQSAASAY